MVDDDHIIMYDKAENNPLRVRTSPSHPAWGALYRISTATVMPLNVKARQFC